LSRISLTLLFIFACCGILGLHPVSPVSARAVVKAVPGCTDFLGQLKKKPAHLVFVSCVSEPARQGKPLRALYRVRGLHAGRVEAALIKSAGLNRLQRSCCQWDSAPVSFKSGSGKDYIVSMTSEDTKISTRAQWRKIPHFQVVVDLLTEEI
jgi:hypothetical protein